jgi:hypothetical protein
VAYPCGDGQCDSGDADLGSIVYSVGVHVKVQLATRLVVQLAYWGCAGVSGLSMSVNQQLAVAHESVMDCITDPNVPSNLLYPQV